MTKLEELFDMMEKTESPTDESMFFSELKTYNQNTDEFKEYWEKYEDYVRRTNMKRLKERK